MQVAVEEIWMVVDYDTRKIWVSCRMADVPDAGDAYRRWVFDLDTGEEIAAN